MKVALEKHKSRIDVNAWFKCVIVAVGLIVVAWFIEQSNALLFSSSGSPWVKGVYYVGLTFIIGSIIWLILYISPRLFRSLFSNTAITETKPAQTQPPVDTNPQPTQTMPPKTEPAPASAQVRWIPVYPETPTAHEETESEKLRREFRNRTF